MIAAAPQMSQGGIKGERDTVTIWKTNGGDYVFYYLKL